VGTLIGNPSPKERSARPAANRTAASKSSNRHFGPAACQKTAGPGCFLGPRRTRATGGPEYKPEIRRPFLATKSTLAVLTIWLAEASVRQRTYLVEKRTSEVLSCKSCFICGRL
jgi:hypothetical protein